MTLCFWSSHFRLPSAGLAGGSLHSQFTLCRGLSPGLHKWSLPTEPHPRPTSLTPEPDVVIALRVCVHWWGWARGLWLWCVFRPQSRWEQSTPLLKHAAVGVLVRHSPDIRVICRRRRWSGVVSNYVNDVLCPGKSLTASFVFPATFHNTIYTLHSSKRKIPAPSHFQVILCILIRSSQEKFDNTLELGPSFPWLLPENWLLKHSGHWIYKLLSAWKRLTPGCSVSPCIYQFRFIMKPLFLPRCWKLKPRPCACQGQTCSGPGPIPTQRFITFC